MVDCPANPGSGPSLEELLLKHSGPIRRIIERRSGHLILKQTTVEDLYQETVAAAIASSDTFCYSTDAQFMSWIATIVRRAISRQLRGPQRALGSERIRGAGSSGPGVPESRLYLARRTPSSSAAGHEGEDRLQRAIRDLPRDYRMAVTLYKLEERSLAEVAAQMGRTKGATCRLLARAMDVLRETLGEL
jgi:RNA polymerase sigma factor (sigma-70 family)